MADHNSRREYTKRKLRSNMIDPDSRVEIRTPAQLPAVKLVIIGIIVLAVAFFIIRSQVHVGTEAVTVWEKEIGGESAAVTFRGYAGFMDGVIMYSRDGAEYVDSTGRSVWQKSYQMNDPVINVRDEYAVIADQGGTTAAVFSSEQSTGSIVTAMPISKAVISSTGVVYTVENDEDADYLRTYRKDGSEIDLTVKSVIDGDGYPFDISVSPGGSQLITAYIGVSESSVTSSVVFRNFGEVGQNSDAKRVVGGFIDDFENHVVTKVGFADEEYSHAFYDGGVVFFSTRVLNSPEVLVNEVIPQQILSVADSSEGCALYTEPGENDTGRQLLIYDNEGVLTGKAAIDYNVTGMEMNGKNVILYNDSRFCAYTFSGRKIADVDWDGRITAVCGTEELREFVVAENGRYLYIKAK